MALTLFRALVFSSLILVLASCLPIITPPFYEPQFTVGKNIRPRCATGAIESVDIPIADHLKANVRLFRRLDKYNHLRSFGYLKNEGPPSPDELYISIFFSGKDVKALRFASEAFVLSDLKEGRKIDLRQSFNLVSGKDVVDPRSLLDIVANESNFISLSFVVNGFAPQEMQMQFPKMLINGQIKEVAPVVWIYRLSGVGLEFICG